MFVNMKIAIVILNWNGKELLKQFLPSIIKHSSSENCDIYVADNASTDGSVEFIISNFPTIKIIQNATNGGYAKGYNDALRYIDADVYALVNSDIEVTKNWLVPIISEFKKNSKTSIIQPKIKDFNNREFFEYAGAGGGFIDKYGFPYCRGRIFDTVEKDTQQYDDIQSVFWASGACFFIRKEVFNALKGFDESFFAHQEEIDLCWKAQQLNYEIKYVGTSTVYHVGGATLHQSSSKKTYLNFRNSLRTLFKNIPLTSLLPTFFIRLVFDGIAAIRFLLQFKFPHFWAIIRSHINFYWNLKHRFKSRKNNLQKRGDYYQIKSIVWEYFIKKKKKSNEL